MKPTQTAKSRTNSTAEQLTQVLSTRVPSEFAAKVSLWLGHEGNSSLIHRHYRGLATKAQAEAFFALRPS